MNTVNVKTEIVHKKVKFLKELQATKLLSINAPNFGHLCCEQAWFDKCSTPSIESHRVECSQYGSILFAFGIDTSTTQTGLQNCSWYRYAVCWKENVARNRFIWPQPVNEVITSTGSFLCVRCLHHFLFDNIRK